MTSCAMAPDIELSDRRRRVVLDWTLAAAIIACVAGFVELRSSVSELSRTTMRLELKMSQMEIDTKHDQSTVATKSDVARIEARIDRLAELLAQRAHNR